MLFSDVDGVIAVYTPEDYIPEDDGIMPFLKKPHYFLYRKENKNIIETYRILNRHLPVHIMTNIPASDGTFEEDKKIWLSEKLPFIPESRIHIIKIPKHVRAKHIIGMPLTKEDILISDFNGDLFPWRQAGGSGIKYLNGINSASSWSGYAITQEYDPEKQADTVLKIIKNIKKEPRT